VPRVVVVDDNEITRTGVIALLRADPRVDVVAALDHDEARSWDGPWDRIDTVLLDAADESRDDDQFPGVGVVTHVRACAPSAVVVVLTGHFLNDGLRRRMREVGADFFYARTSVSDAASLAAIVCNPEEARRVPPPADPAALAALGITPASRIDDLVTTAERDGLLGALGARGLTPGHRSRWWTSVRRRLASAGRVAAVNRDGTPPRRDQDVPSLHQLRRIYDWATKVTPRD